MRTTYRLPPLRPKKPSQEEIARAKAQAETEFQRKRQIYLDLEEIVSKEIERKRQEAEEMTKIMRDGAHKMGSKDDRPIQRKFLNHFLKRQ